MARWSRIIGSVKPDQRIARPRLFMFGIAALAFMTLVTESLTAGRSATTIRTTPVYDPPVLAGQMAVPIWCSAGVYARHGDQIVVTSSGHCFSEGMEVRDENGLLIGVLGPVGREPTCAYPDHACAAADMDYMFVAADRIPWGHLNQIDLGAGGYRVITPDTHPLDCAGIKVNDIVEINGRLIYRTGHVVEKGENLSPANEDALYMPCMVAANISVATGDSGGIVFVNGIPSGVVARRFDGWLGFTPISGGLAELGLTVCDTPNCGLTPPVH